MHQSISKYQIEIYIMKTYFLFILCIFSILCEARSKKVLVSFYNVENLFDTIDAADVIDEEFTPLGRKKWNTERYNTKLTNIASVIKEVGFSKADGYPAIVGLCEVENEQVVKDLINTKELSAAKYKYVHINSPDRRGIDVALLFRKGCFKLEHFKSYRLKMPNDSNFRSRDQLVVKGKLNKKEVNIIVNHWPSRRGGAVKSEPLRLEAAKMCKHIVDSIMQNDKDSGILIMGDFNDNPDNKSLTEVLKTYQNKNRLGDNLLFNPFYNLYKSGVGSLCYRDNWDLFDMILLSEKMIHNSKLKFHDFGVYSPDHLKQSSGKYKGYPNRTFGGSLYLGGYSDHFSSYVVFQTR